MKLSSARRIPHFMPPIGHAGALAVVVAAVSAFGVGTALGDKPSPVGLKVEAITVNAQPIAAFDKANPKRTRFGKLTWRGGLILTSPSPNFGGWSGLTMDPDGKKFLAVSDAGTWLTGSIGYTYSGRPSSISSARLGPLLTRSGKPLTRGRDRDAEGVALKSGTLTKGEVLISFERNHRIGRFRIGPDGVSAPSSYIALPPETEAMKSNGGLEAVAVLKGGPNKGSLVAISERLRDRHGNHQGWIWEKGKPRGFTITNSGDFDVTDIAALPDGSLLLLERRFRWSEGVKARLRLMRRNELRPGARVVGETLLRADLNYEIDNMEGLAVHVGAGREIIVTMISDNNFNAVLQRTVLLQFALDGAVLASADGIKQ